MFLTYMLVDSFGIPFYVGAGNEARPMSHINGRGGRPLVDAVIEDHRSRGAEISVVIVEEFEAAAEAFSLEVELISTIGRLSEGGSLVNICDGGKGSSGYTASDEERERNSRRGKERFSILEERIKTSIATKLAMENPEVREKISRALKEKWLEDGFRKKLVDAHTGRKDSDQTKLKKAAAQKSVWAKGLKTGKYTDEQVRDVYDRKGVDSAVNIAKIHGMNPTYVHKIWRHERCLTSLIRLGIVPPVTAEKVEEGLR